VGFAIDSELVDITVGSAVENAIGVGEISSNEAREADIVREVQLATCEVALVTIPEPMVTEQRDKALRADCATNASVAFIFDPELLTMLNVVAPQPLNEMDENGCNMKYGIMTFRTSLTSSGALI